MFEALRELWKVVKPLFRTKPKKSERSQTVLIIKFKPSRLPQLAKEFYETGRLDSLEKANPRSRRRVGVKRKRGKNDPFRT